MLGAAPLYFRSTGTSEKIDSPGSGKITVYVSGAIADLETGEPASFTSPDSVTFRVKEEPSGTPVEISGNQEGSTDAWNAVHDFTTAGKFSWQAEVVEGSDKGVNRKQWVIVEESIADV